MPEFGAAKAGDRREGITETQSEVTGLQGAFEQQVGQSGVTLKEALESKRKLDKIDNDSWLLDTVNAYRKEARDTYGQEFTKGGRDTVGAVDRTREGFDKFQADIRANAPNKQYANLATSQISSIFNPLQDKLSDHGLKQLETGMINSLNNEVDAIAEEVFVSGGTPEALQAGIDQTRLQFDLYRENYGNDKADILEQQAVENVAIEALKRQIGADPAGTAEAITRGDYNEFIDTETRDDLLQMASGQANINETRAKQAEVARVEEVNQGLFDSFADGTLDISTIKSVDIPTSNKTAWESKLTAQAKKPGRFDKSNDNTHSDIFTRITLDPENVTSAEITKLMGASGDDWLSITDTKSLIGDLETQRKGDGTSPEGSRIKNTIKQIDADWQAGVYSTDDDVPKTSDANRERNNIVRDLIEWTQDPDNKGKDPAQWYNDKTREFRATSYGRWLWFSPTASDETRAANLEAELLSELPQADQLRIRRQTAKFGFNERDVLRRARENDDNADFSDEQIIEAWRLSSGG